MNYLDIAKAIILVIIVLLYLCYYDIKCNSVINTVKYFNTKGLFYKGGGGMSNTILGYYSCVYLSILMKRYFRMNYLNKLGEYYQMPNFFFTNITSTKYIYVNIKNLKSIYILLEHKINIFLTTYFDILEGIIPLCKSNITKCLYINIRHINNIHEIYKLRKKLINELLIPKKTLQNLYTRIKNDNKGFIIGIHIRTAIYSDFKENDYRFYNNETELLYFHAIQNVLQKYKKKKKKLYIISDSTKIKYKFMKKYNKFVIIDMNLYNEKISHNINDLSIKEQFVLSNCNVIIGSCASTFTLLSVFRNLNDYYAIQGVNKGSCGYALDNKHLLFFNTKEI